MTEAVDGEAVHLRVHDASEGMTHTVIQAVLARPEPLYQASAVYHENSFYLVDALQIAEDAEHKPPMASFSVDTPNGAVSFKVAFDASASADPDGTIAQYTWTSATVRAARGSRSHTQTVGTYTVRLTVTNDDGGTNSIQKIITVTAGGKEPSDSPLALRR